MTLFHTVDIARYPLNTSFCCWIFNFEAARAKDEGVTVGESQSCCFLLKADERKKKQLFLMNCHDAEARLECSINLVVFS